jgi:hypothetical protein
MVTKFPYRLTSRGRRSGDSMKSRTGLTLVDLCALVVSWFYGPAFWLCAVGIEGVTERRPLSGGRLRLRSVWLWEQLHNPIGERDSWVLSRSKSG